MPGDGAEHHYWVAFSNAVEGRDDEFNEWYDHDHIPALLKVPGIVAARRYQLHSAQSPRRERPTHRYMVIYEIEGDVQAVHEHLAATWETRGWTSALADDSLAWVYTPMGERITAPATAAETGPP